VTLVATHVSDEIKKLSKLHATLEINQRSFLETDLENIDFVISAVNNKTQAY